MTGVSVLLATYEPRWLEEAISSVLSQTHEELELLILDDEPSDETRQVAASYGDPRVRYLPTDHRVGPAATHARGLEAATYPLVAIINHDDRWRSRLLERLTGELERHPNAVLAFCDTAVMDELGQVLGEGSDALSQQWGRAGLEPGLHTPFVELALIEKTVPMAQGTVFRKADLTGTLPPQAGPAYDWFLTYLLARTGLGAVYVSDRLALWRAHSENLTSELSWTKVRGNLYVYDRFLSDPAIRDCHDVLSARRRRERIRAVKLPFKILMERVGALFGRRDDVH